MTTLIIEGFENYTNLATTLTVTGLTRQFNTVTISGNNIQMGTNYARWSGGVGINIGNNNNMMEMVFPSAYGTVSSGMAFCEISAITNIHRLMGWFDGTSNEGPNLRVNASGILEAYRGTTLLGTASHAALTTGVWHYAEMKSVISDAAGTFEIWLDGIQVLNLTSVDTKPSTNATMDRMYFGGKGDTSSAKDRYFDDMYAADGTLHGDCKVVAFFPSGAGNTTQWTPLSGANYTNVDEQAFNDDTDYNSSSTATQKDTFALPDTSGIASVKAVRVVAVARKDDAGTREIAIVTRSGGTDYESANMALTSSYAPYGVIHDTNPNGGGAWTTGAVDAMEIGYIVKT